MRILVTGGHGFIGKAAVESLASQGHEVFAPRRSECDLLDATSRQELLDRTRPETLVHLAWQTKHGVFWTAPDNVSWRDATIGFLHEFLESGGRRAVLAGTCAEYDWHTGAKRLVETAPCKPATLYGRCKHETFTACEKLVAEGVSIAWGRLFLLMGPRETPARFMPSIIRPMLQGHTAQMSDGRGLRDFMHCADAGAAFGALATHEMTGAINIASGHGVSLVDVAKIAAARIPNGQLDIGALPPREDEPDALVADVTRMTQELKFIPRHTIESAVEECVEYWKAQASAT
jgi:nucleoside-diphosphate-sugar epimerase